MNETYHNMENAARFKEIIKERTNHDSVVLKDKFNNKMNITNLFSLTNSKVHSSSNRNDSNDLQEVKIKQDWELHKKSLERKYKASSKNQSYKFPRTVEYSEPLTCKTAIKDTIYETSKMDKIIHIRKLSNVSKQIINKDLLKTIIKEKVDLKEGFSKTIDLSNNISARKFGFRNLQLGMPEEFSTLNSNRKRIIPNKIRISKPITHKLNKLASTRNNQEKFSHPGCMTIKFRLNFEKSVLSNYLKTMGTNHKRNADSSTNNYLQLRSYNKMKHSKLQVK